MKKILVLCLLIGMWIFGAEIRVNEAELKSDNLIYKTGDTLPFTGKILDYYPIGNPGPKLLEANVVQGLIRDFTQFDSTGKPVLEGVVDGVHFTGTGKDFYPSGVLKTDIVFAFEKPGEKAFQTPLFSFFTRDAGKFDQARVKELMETGSMKLAVKSFPESNSTAPENMVNVNAETINGYLVGTADGVTTQENAASYDMQFKLGDFRKLNFDVFKDINNLKDPAAGKKLYQELEKLETGEIVFNTYNAEKKPTANAMTYLSGGKIAGEFNVPQPTPVKMTWYLDGVLNVDSGKLQAAATNPDKMEVLAIALQELAKITAFKFSVDTVQQNKLLYVDFSMALGKVDIDVQELWPSKTPKTQLVIRIPDIKTPDVKQINPQNPFGILQLYNIEGDWREYDEKGAVTEDQKWNAMTVMGVVQKIMQKMNQ